MLNSQQHSRTCDWLYAADMRHQARVLLYKESTDLIQIPHTCVHIPAKSQLTFNRHTLHQQRRLDLPVYNVQQLQWQLCMHPSLLGISARRAQVPDSSQKLVPEGPDAAEIWLPSQICGRAETVRFLHVHGACCR
jgi:hypothetical protein